MFDKREIEDLTVDELRECYEAIVSRVRYLNELQLRSRLDRFQAGDYVEFYFDDGVGTGHVVRVNRKTLTVASDQGYFRVDPRDIAASIGRRSATNPRRMPPLPQ